MSESESLDVLFFDLASESRLGILHTLNSFNLRMQDIARKLDLTATEASRQLQRLNKAKLIERLPDSTYTVTNFGKLMLALSSSMEFAFRHKAYFSEHTVWHLPSSFINRLGELSQGALVNDLNEDLIRWEELIKAAEDHVWVMTSQVMPPLSRAMGDKLGQGIKLRSLLSNKPSEISKNYAQQGKNVERRYLSSVPTIILATEKEACVSFPLFTGELHFASFFGKEASFLKWVNELFVYYWDSAEKFL